MNLNSDPCNLRILKYPCKLVYSFPPKIQNQKHATIAMPLATLLRKQIKWHKPPTLFFSFQIAVILHNRKTKTNKKVMKEKANRRHYEKSSPVTHIQTVRDHTLMAGGGGARATP
ncbi:hypothetical protein CEXT_3921 [Caerostris extrusa]|uniref:Uncharacterized protein n=1 Tax=Caerostris extrusa TaxID=172846 RepID=A0AAV4RME2_CAEEX|nr:hypothetical protein CEXT_3921 [Caerostris extrusa]